MVMDQAWVLRITTTVDHVSLAVLERHVATCPRHSIDLYFCDIPSKAMQHFLDNHDPVTRARLSPCISGDTTRKYHGRLSKFTASRSVSVGTATSKCPVRTHD